MQCFVSQLKRNFSDTLIGLQIGEDGRACLNPSAFTCCQRNELLSLKRLNGVFRCDVISRLQQVNGLLEKFQSVWERPFSFYSNRNDRYIDHFFQTINRRREDKLTKGRVFQSKLAETEPSYHIWLMALVSIWRFGIPVHVVSLGKSSSADIFPSKLDPNLIIFVEQKAPFRHPYIAFDFAALVNWCEGYLLPLWIDVLLEVRDKTEMANLSNLNTKKAFKDKISQYKLAPPFSWLERDSLSRIKNICHGYEEYC